MPAELTNSKSLEQENITNPVQKSGSVNINSSQAGLSQIKTLKAGSPARTLVSNAPSKQKSISSKK